MKLQGKHDIDISRWFDRGYAYGENEIDLPQGFCRCKNMMLTATGMWVPRYTYKKNHATGVSGPAYCKYVHCFNQDNLLGIFSDGSAKYKGAADASWNACSWTGGGAAPTLTGSFDNCLNYSDLGYVDYVLFSDGNKVVTFSSDGQQYDYFTGSDVGYGGYLIEHEGRVLIGRNESNKVYYTETGSVGTVEGNVSIGNGTENITGMHNVNNLPVVIKQQSIWNKHTRFDDISSDDFLPGFEGANFAGRSIDADNALFCVSTKGIQLIPREGEPVLLSTPFHLNWLTPNSSDSKIFYWEDMGWLIIADGSDSANLYIFDLKTRSGKNPRWYWWTGMPICTLSNSPTTNGVYVGMYASSGSTAYLYELTDKIRPGEANGEESVGDFEQIFQTGWMDFTQFNGAARFYDKYINYLHSYAANVDQVDLYARRSPSLSSPGSATSTLTTVGNVQGMTAPVRFSEISIKYSAASGVGNSGGSMIIAGIMPSIEFRRKSA